MTKRAREELTLAYLDTVLAPTRNGTGTHGMTHARAAPNAARADAEASKGPSRASRSAALAEAERLVTATSVAIRFPAASSTMVVSRSDPRLSSSLRIEKVERANFQKSTLLDRELVPTRIPIDIFVPPVRQPNLPSPVISEGLLLVPDVSANIVYVLSSVPKVMEFNVVVNVDANGATSGASASLMVGLRSAAASRTAGSTPQIDGALRSAGYRMEGYTTRGLPLAKLVPRLELPAGHESAPQKVLGNADAATATFLISLSVLGAQVWRQAFESGSFALPGICSVVTVHAVQDVRAKPASRELQHEVTLQALAGSVGARALSINNAEQSVSAKLVVDADPIVESTLIEFQASTGQMQTAVFGSDGGTLALQLAGPDLAQQEVRWQATVAYRIDGWPPIRSGGALTRVAWSDLIVPSSWKRQLRLSAILLDGAGNVLTPARAGGDRVVASLDFTADYLPSPGLHNSFETQNQLLITAELPQPPGMAAGALKLTVFAQRGGRDELLVRNVATDESWILARVYANGRIEIITNKTPGEEAARDSETQRVLAELAAPEVPAQELPSIRAYLAADAGPPRFEIHSGPNPYWGVEIATHPTLFLPDHGTRRSDANYFTTVSAPPLALSQGSELTLPWPKWELLRPSRAFWYRLWTSRQATAWSEAAVTVSNALVDSAPSLRW